METTIAWYWLGLLGVISGIISGSLGLGAGVFLVPALVIMLGVGQKAAQGTALVVMVPMALAGAIRYYMNPAIKIEMTTVLTIIPFAIVGALIGSALAGFLPASVLRKCFGVIVIVAGIKMIMQR